MNGKYNALAITWGILIPLFTFSISFMLVMITDDMGFGIFAVRLESMVLGALSVVAYGLSLLCFRKAGYTGSGLTLAYFFTFTALLVAGFSFVSHHDFVVAYGVSDVVIRALFRICFFDLGLFAAVSAVVCLGLEFAKYVNKLKQ